MTFDLLGTDPHSEADRGVDHRSRYHSHSHIYARRDGWYRKRVHQRELKEDVQPDIILGNTHHLYLRPGTEILKLLEAFINL